ncbi:metallophosphoesterase family protein [Paraglaciecola sp. 20A4]|uniref:purple acid phosphatase family protein n=1 Tax=Paraglaciecola sp. 20A4 TaxID=2687288 RepID=UPI00140AE5FE|nr:metallophosphoesterase family protein [Paraglaciecola sp. 20A4]
MKTLWISLFILLLIGASNAVNAQSSQTNSIKDNTPYITASSWPDRIIVTPTESPSTSISVTWRSDQTVTSSYAQIVQANPDARYDIHATTFEASTQTTPLNEGNNNLGAFTYSANAQLSPVNYHSITFEGLVADTLYNYRVSGAMNQWSSWQQIKTAAQKKNSDVEFLYFGDAQNGIYSHWPLVLRKAWLHGKNADFAIYAGDLVNEGASDRQWSNWLNAGRFIHAMLPAILVPGNHEYDWQVHKNQQKEWALSTLWQDQFTLPPAPALPTELQETVYVTHYPDLDIFVLNSEALGSVSLLQAQARWLNQKLENSTAKWRIVTMHHPVFSSCGMPLNTPGQDEPDVRAAFLPVFLKHNVDLVLQGHDHTYSRGSIGTIDDIAKIANETTQKKVKSVFVTSVAGPKTYPQKLTRWQEYRDYGVTLERIGENTPTYQIINKSANELKYQSFTTDGERYDGFTLEKDQNGQNTLIIDSGLPPQRTFINTGPYTSHHDLAE